MCLTTTMMKSFSRVTVYQLVANRLEKALNFFLVWHGLSVAASGVAADEPPFIQHVYAQFKEQVPRCMF